MTQFKSQFSHDWLRTSVLAGMLLILPAPAFAFCTLSEKDGAVKVDRLPDGGADLTVTFKNSDCLSKTIVHRVSKARLDAIVHQYEVPGMWVWLTVNSAGASVQQLTPAVDRRQEDSNVTHYATFIALQYNDSSMKSYETDIRTRISVYRGELSTHFDYNDLGRHSRLLNLLGDFSLPANFDSSGNLVISFKVP